MAIENRHFQKKLSFDKLTGMKVFEDFRKQSLKKRQALKPAFDEIKIENKYLLVFTMRVIENNRNNRKGEDQANNKPANNHNC